MKINISHINQIVRVMLCLRRHELLVLQQVSADRGRARENHNSLVCASVRAVAMCTQWCGSTRTKTRCIRTIQRAECVRDIWFLTPRFARLPASQPPGFPVSQPSCLTASRPTVRSRPLGNAALPKLQSVEARTLFPGAAFQAIASNVPTC